MLLFAAIAWRVVRFGLVFPMWGDEGMLAVNFHDRGFFALLEPLDYGQVAPPGFLWLELAASRLFGFSEATLRLVPFVAGTAAVLLFWCAVRKLLDHRSALLAMAVFAASFYPVRYAAEVKPYSVDLLLALAIILAAWAVYELPGVTGRWIAFTAVGSVSVWLSYPSAFVAGGACLWLLTYGSGEDHAGKRGPVVVVGALFVISFVAMYVLAGSGQLAVAPAAYWEAAFPPMRQPWRLPIWLLDVHTGMMLAYPNGGHSGGSTVSFLLAVVGSVVLWRARKPQLMLLLSPLPLMFLAAALEKYPYGASARVAQHIAPAACMLIGTGLVSVLSRVLGRRGTVRFLPIALLPFLVVVVGGIVRDIALPHHSRADAIARDVVRQIGRESAPDDRWVVYASRDRAGHAPHFTAFVGMGGRIHFQILCRAPGTVLWAPDPAGVRRPVSGRTWLIAYGNRVFEPDRGELDAYRAGLADALGATSSVVRHELPDREWIEVARLDPR